MVVIIAGSRTITDYAIVERAIERSGWQSEIWYVLEGEEPNGVDNLAKIWAENNGAVCLPFEADWDKYGNPAGPIRNRTMGVFAAKCQGRIILIWDGKSKGSRNMKEIAQGLNLPIYEEIIT